MQKEFQLLQFLDLFEEWNQKLNLTSTKDRHELEVKHVQDSLALLEIFELEEGQRVLDLGSGGGFPGIPLAIMAPETEFVLVDSTEKKMRAVQAIANELGLSNVQTVVGRAEELAHQPLYRERFGLVVSRAVAALPTLLEFAAGFVCVHGVFVAYKSGDYEAELEQSAHAIKTLGFSFEGPIEYELSDGMGSRSFLIFSKTKALSDEYPRMTGIPKKKPL